MATRTSERARRTSATAGSPFDAEDPQTLREYFRRMVLIRRFEERAAQGYTQAKIGGYCHLNLGEEAMVVGLMAALRPTDYLFANYREHGYAIAKGIAPGRVMAELYGRTTGTSKGWGGSMHMFDRETRMLGGYGVVGGQVPLATGAALAIDYRGGDEVVMCQMGDGTTNIGAFHESLNIAALWNLPIVFVVINNGLGMGTTVERSSAEPELHKRASAYRMRGERVDGDDLEAVLTLTGELLDRARDEREPAVLEAVTYRYRGHSVADAGWSYRSKDEVQAHREHDPIERAAKWLELSEDEVDELREQAKERVRDAVKFADASDEPDVESLGEHVYGDPDTAEQFARMSVGAPFGEAELLHS